MTTLRTGGVNTRHQPIRGQEAELWPIRGRLLCWCQRTSIRFVYNPPSFDLSLISKNKYFFYSQYKLICSTLLLPLLCIIASCWLIILTISTFDYLRFCFLRELNKLLTSSVPESCLKNPQEFCKLSPQNWGEDLIWEPPPLWGHRASRIYRKHALKLSTEKRYCVLCC